MNWLSVICWYFVNTITKCKADGTWNRFTSNQRYANLRLVTELDNVFPSRYIPKHLPLMSSTLDCSDFCAANQSCKAFNLYETNTSYVCELLPDNLCGNLTRKAFINWPGSFVWEKLSPQLTTSCLAALHPANNQLCTLLHPGCVGIDLQSCDCVRTCRECSTRFGQSGYYECTYWPDSDLTFTLPIFGICFGLNTYLLRRNIDLDTGTVTFHYQMSFVDMNRLSKLGAYPSLQFWFKTPSGFSFSTSYFNFFIDANGTLMNMTFDPNFDVGTNDIFNLNGGALKPTPFITVKDDLYGCGSFWLLDTSNATYCPGGKVGMLGSVVRNGSQVTSTGIRRPFVTAGTILCYTVITLA